MTAVPLPLQEPASNLARVAGIYPDVRCASMGHQGAEGREGTDPVAAAGPRPARRLPPARIRVVSSQAPSNPKTASEPTDRLVTRGELREQRHEHGHECRKGQARNRRGLRGARELVPSDQLPSRSVDEDQGSIGAEQVHRHLLVGSDTLRDVPDQRVGKQRGLHRSRGPSSLILGSDNLSAAAPRRRRITRPKTSTSTPVAALQRVREHRHAITDPEHPASLQGISPEGTRERRAKPV